MKSIEALIAGSGLDATEKKKLQTLLGDYGVDLAVVPNPATLAGIKDESGWNDLKGATKSFVVNAMLGTFFRMIVWWPATYTL